jgi:hypothetical protein
VIQLTEGEVTSPHPFSEQALLSGGHDFSRATPAESTSGFSRDFATSAALSPPAILEIFIEGT